MIARQGARNPANDAKFFVGYHLAPSLWNHYKVIDRRRPTNDTHVGQSLVGGSIGDKKSWVSIAGNAIRPGVIRSGKSHRLLAEELLA